MITFNSHFTLPGILIISLDACLDAKYSVARGSLFWSQCWQVGNLLLWAIPFSKRRMVSMIEYNCSTRGSAMAEEPRDALCQLKIKYYGRFLTGLLTRSYANPEEPCEHTFSWNRVKWCTNVRRIACENVCNRWMTFIVIQGHCRCHHSISHILFPISLPLKVYANLATFSRY